MVSNGARSNLPNLPWGTFGCIGCQRRLYLAQHHCAAPFMRCLWVDGVDGEKPPVCRAGDEGAPIEGPLQMFWSGKRVGHRAGVEAELWCGGVGGGSSKPCIFTGGWSFVPHYFIIFFDIFIFLFITYNLFITSKIYLSFVFISILKIKKNKRILGHWGGFLYFFLYIDCWKK